MEYSREMSMPKKKKSRIYFGMDVQDAIVRYNTSESDAERNKIYGNEIHKAFDKLAENIINTFKFSYFDYGFEDVKCEVVAFLVMNMHKYDHTKGSKAFSYFSVVAKNYLILHNNNNYKKMKIHDDVSVLNGKSDFSAAEKSEVLIEFLGLFVHHLDSNISSMFKKKRDMNIAYALVELLRRPQEIENFNKKSLYILIREMANVETVHITNVVNILKLYYKDKFEEYSMVGELSCMSNKFF
jgi:hypothetical protein